MPSLGDELLTNARLVDGGAKVILLLLIFFVFVLALIMSISCCFNNRFTGTLSLSSCLERWGDP